MMSIFWLAVETVTIGLDSHIYSYIDSLFFVILVAMDGNVLKRSIKVEIEASNVNKSRM